MSIEKDNSTKLLFARPWSFYTAASDLSHLPDDDYPEIAFAGRSNVGKSSLINALTNQTKLARTSHTPGRTQELIFFKQEYAPLLLVDMPGYGYAKVSKSKSSQWQQLIHDYLRGRVMLRRVLLLIDARHGLKQTDIPILQTLDDAAVSWQIVLTKCDAVKDSDLALVTRKIETDIKPYASAFPEILYTSSRSQTGIGTVQYVISQFLI